MKYVPVKILSIVFKSYLILLLMTMASRNIYGQEPTYFFPANIFDQYEGARSLQVCDIDESEDHTIWMITNGGLLRFDGYEWHKIEDIVRIPISKNSKIRALENGTVFIAGHDQREMLICKYENDQFIKFPVPDDYDISNIRYPIEQISFDVTLVNTDTNLAIILEGELFFYTSQNKLWKKINISEYDDLRYIQNLKFVKNKLYVNSLNYFYELQGDKLFRVAGQPEEGCGRILDFTAKNDTVLFFTPKLLGCLSGKIDTLSALSLNTDFQPGMAEIIWDGKEFIYLSNKSPIHKYSLKTHKIHQIMVDHHFNVSISNCMLLDDENILWVGTDRGLLMFENFMFCYMNKNSGLLENEVAASFESENFGLILGSNIGFSIVKDKKIRTFEVAKENDYFNYRLLEILEHGNELLMASNFYGLGVFTKNGLKFEYPKNEKFPGEGATSAIVRHRNKILVARGHDIFERTSNGYRYYVQAKSYVRNLYSHSNGSLYISTARGLQIYDGTSLISVEVDDYQWSNTFCVFEYDSLTLMGTTYGLMQLEGSTAVPFSFTEQNFHTPVYESTVDSKNRLWLGTSSGLFVYDGVNFINYNIVHGLSGNEINRNGLFEMKNGQLLIATDRGVSFFKPDDELKPIICPTPIIHSIRTENSNFDLTDSTLEIPVHEKWIEIEFGIQELKYQKSVNFRVKLEGYDNSWHVFTNEKINSINYSNLPSGKFPLLVEARYGIGPWSKIESSISLDLVAPFYRTWWFFTLMGLLIIVLTVGIHQLRIRYLTRQKSSLDQQIKDQTKVLIKQKAQLIENNRELEKALDEKTLLLKELHHRVKNNLQIITSLLNIQSNIIQDPKAIEVFRKSQNRIHAMALVHNMLYLSDTIAHVNLQEYFQELIYAISSAYTHDKNNPRVLVEAQNIRLNIDDSINLGLIVNELVSNSFKYGMSSNGSGTIRVLIQTIKDGKMELTVTDSGSGLPSGFDIKNHAQLGLEIVTSLTEQLSGELEYENRNGAWFRIIFSPSGGSNSIR